MERICIKCNKWKKMIHYYKFDLICKVCRKKEIEPSEKTCIRCNEKKPIKSFHKRTEENKVCISCKTIKWVEEWKGHETKRHRKIKKDKNKSTKKYYEAEYTIITKEELIKLREAAKAENEEDNNSLIIGVIY
jgi:hypothetical protein